MEKTINLLLCCLSLSVLQSQEDIGLELTLVNALHNGVPGPQTPNLLLDAQCHGGTWDRVWANARNYNIAIHWGRIERSVMSADAIELDLAMSIEGDSWVQGGRAIYKMKLKRDPDGRLEGMYQGRYKKADSSGRVFGRVKPPVAAKPGFIPFEPGEHPRIIFRKTDLPRLRELTKTPFGRAALDALPTTLPKNMSCYNIPDAIGLGMRYQLTGDPVYAEKCREAVIWHMNDTSSPAFAIGRQWGKRLEHIAIGYDLCCDTSDTAFRKQVAAYLRFTCTMMFNDPLKMSQNINWNVGSNYAGPIYAGIAFSGLALDGEPGPEPARPLAPEPVVDILPAADYAPPTGVPVVPLPLNGAAKSWLTASVGFGMSNDPMDGGLSGFASLRPEPGTKVRIDDAETTFAVLDAQHVMSDPNKPLQGGINLKSGHIAAGKTFTLFAYHVIKVDAPARLKLRAPFSKSGRVQVVLNGRFIANGQVVDVKPGLYPFLICLRLPANLWGSLEPWFELATPEDVAASEASLESAKVEYVDKMKDYEFDLARWKSNGNRDVQFEKLNEMGRRMMYLFCREGCGDGGYQTESGHYYEDAIDGPARYAHAYWTAYGKRLSTFDDITAFNTRKMMAKVILDGRPGSNGTFIEQKISHNYGEANVLRTLTELYPQIDAQYRPALLWHWNRELGGDPLKPDLMKLAAAWPVYSLVNYPIDRAGLAPTDPIKDPRMVMPLTWSASGFGYYICRNGWSGPKQDIIVQMFAKAKGPLGWGGPDGSTFRIWGMGSAWAEGNTDREVRRIFENVVAMKDDQLSEDACGIVCHQQMQADGSGTMTIDVSNQFFTKDVKDSTERGPRRETYGGYAHPATKLPVVKDPIRAFAVDYSRTSGAPMLFSVLDRIDGGGAKEWLWHVDTSRVTVHGNAFIITGEGGVSMQVTFVAPQQVDIVAKAAETKIKQSAGPGSGSEIRRIENAVRVSGKDPNDGRFWVVATLSDGKHPVVQVEGAGLDAKVTVGGQRVTFVGTHLVMGK